MKLISLLLILCSTAIAQVDYESMLRNTCNFYEFMRTSNGDYLDFYNGNKPKRSLDKVSSAATGAGLVSLAISHKLQYDSYAKQKALKTLKFLNGKGNVKPVRNVNGLFLHFYKVASGDFGQREFSTIDTALLVSGAIFCKNVFADDLVSQEVNTLWKSIKWQTFKVDAFHYFLTQDEKGKGLGKTRMFNEYLLLADYCSLDSNTKPLLINDKWIRCRAFHGSVLSDLQNRMLPLFTFQFPLYLSPVRSKDKSFLREALKAAAADKVWWENEIKVSGIWGSSAGSSKHGYGVDATGKNHYRIIHAPAVAAFAPFNPAYKKDFEKILNDYPKIIQTYEKWSIAWRHSLKDPDWPAKTIQSIDVSPLLYGLAALHPKLGYKFFKKNSQYIPGRN